MANNATGSLAASIMNDLSRQSLGGNMSFVPRDANDLWVYKEVIFDSASEPVIRAGIQFTERTFRSDGTELETHANDQLRWLAIKNTGTTNGTTTTTEGIVVSFDGDNAAYDELEGIYIGAGELWVSKFPSATTIAQLYAASVAVTSDVPSGTGSDVLCIVAAILDNVA